jgi:cyclophilin family peptidyl-prolyl cis-trans isomerase
MAEIKDPENTLLMETTKGNVVIEMYPDLAPGHVARIKKLAREGAYDGVVFHRVIDGFMAQTGDVKFGSRHRRSTSRAGMGGSDNRSEAGVQQRAAACAAALARWRARRTRTPPTRSSSSCFDDARFLDKQYTVWGEVISGMDNVDKIKRGEPVRDPDKIVSLKVAADA